MVELLGDGAVAVDAAGAEAGVAGVVAVELLSAGLALSAAGVAASAGLAPPFPA